MTKLQAEGFEILVVDTDKRPDDALRYGVNTVPSFLVIEPGDAKTKDRTIGRKVGGMRENDLRAFLKSKGVVPKTLPKN